MLASHAGTTLQAVLDACEAGTIAGRVSVVISNNSSSGALHRARAAGAAALHLSGKTHATPQELDRAICAALQRHRVDVVLLAGYMKKLGPATLGLFKNRIINTHPALLPKYGGQGMYGLNVHRAVLKAGELESGPSIHLVDAEYDTGPILAQAKVPVLEGDTPESLASRVQQRERSLLVEVLASMASRN